jgi:threonine synthase
MAGLDYAGLCFEFLRRFATDIPEAELRPIVAAAHLRFPVPEAAPLRSLSERLRVLELFHGPTLSFKDFALQLLGQLYRRQCRLSGKAINALGATSGDTGAAAIHGLLGVPGAAIFILYPEGRISPLQERQMACTGASNVHPLAIEGTFDDAQAAVKEIFADPDFRARHSLAAVNSINLARILAQCVYYLHAWLRLPEPDRSEAEFVVPTGNFGNVLAGWMLRKMGIPIRGFKVATNQNDILHRLHATGEYRVESVRPSLAPSMDIQVASNFERFLYYSLGGDTARVTALMDRFRTTGACAVPQFAKDVFTTSRCPDEEIPKVIRRIHGEFGYVVDPHTACAFAEVRGDRPAVILATASPAKFPETIRAAIGIEPTDPLLEALKSRPVLRKRLPADPAAIRAYIAARAA